jgi:hypothetical protein
MNDRVETLTWNVELGIERLRTEEQVHISRPNIQTTAYEYTHKVLAECVVWLTRGLETLAGARCCNVRFNVVNRLIIGEMTDFSKGQRQTESSQAATQRT